MSFVFIQSWFQRQCDGYWEHAHGVTIETLDQPGWLVTIDLQETALQDETMEPFQRENSDKDWIDCEVFNQQFRGQGDISKLGEILQTFQEWATKER